MTRPARPDGSRVLVATRVAASPERAFTVFTEQIDSWWRPNPLFEFTRGRTGHLVFEPGPHGRLVERYDDGTEFLIGAVRHWEPPEGLVVAWRQASFRDDQATELHVRFESVGADQTRVVIEHFGWDTIPRDHAARHGFPLDAFQRRHGEWWQALLVDFATAFG